MLKVSEAMPMKAYAVTEDNEGKGAIYFARHSIEARKAGANDYNAGELRGISCRRAPWADACATEPDVPASLMIENGWHFECWGCGATIDEDWLEEQNLPSGGVLGSQHSRVFCCACCKTDHAALERRRTAFEATAIAAMRERVRVKFPNAAFVTGFGREHARAVPHGEVFLLDQCFVSFDLPGLKHGPASLRFQCLDRMGPQRPIYFVHPSDVETFSALAQAGKDTE